MTPSTRPAWRVRWQVRLKAAALDRALAAGSDPLSDACLLWRAQQLTDPGLRLAAAEAIEGMLCESERNAAEEPYGVTAPGPGQLVRSNRALLTVLAERLRDDGPHGLRGLALSQRLIGIGQGHLYRSPSPLHLKWRLLEVVASLEPRSPWPEH